MWQRPYKFITLFLALLLAVSSWTPVPGRTEAQMRCAGAAPKSVPCARRRTFRRPLRKAGLRDTDVLLPLGADRTRLNARLPDDTRLPDAAGPPWRGTLKPCLPPNPRRPHDPPLRSLHPCLRPHAVSARRSPLSLAPDSLPCARAAPSRARHRPRPPNCLRHLLDAYHPPFPTRRTHPARPPCASRCLACPPALLPVFRHVLTGPAESPRHDFPIHPC